MLVQGPAGKGFIFVIQRPGDTLYLREMAGHAVLTVNGLPGIDCGIIEEGSCLLSSPVVTDLSPERLHGLSWIVPSGSRAGGHDYQHLKRKHKEDPVNNPAPPARKRKQKKKARFGRTQRPKS